MPALQILQLVLAVVILVWDVVLTGRIAQVKNLPRPFVFLTALAGFLLLPALAIHLAMSDAITGRSLTAVDWLWPATVVLFALQAMYAASRRLVNPFLGFCISVYDLMIAVDAVLRFIASTGRPLPSALLVFLAATTGAFAWLTQSPGILASPFFFFVPITAPAFPALRRSAASFRTFLAIASFVWIGAVLSQVLSADQAVASYKSHDPRVEHLQERPANDFDVGLKIFPDLDGAPPPLAIKNDLALVDTLGVTVVSVTVIPEKIDRAGLDSLAHVLEQLRSDSTQLIVTLGYVRQLVPMPGRHFSETQRIAAIGQIVKKLRPDILLPAKDPYDAGVRAAGLRPPEFWENYLTRAAAEAKHADPHVLIGVSASAYETADSSLYAWAAAKGSPIDVVGFSLYPSPSGAKSLDAEHRAADKWMRESGSTKDHWVFAAGGLPLAHGEASQERSVWAALAWATSRPQLKGVVVSEAGDYGSIRGMRAADGHLRSVAFAVMRALKGLKESSGPDSTLAPLKK